jgi:hypothetical protein
MNSSGQVVFMAANGEGASVIYQGKVGSLKKLVRNNKLSSQSPFTSLESHCSINDLGDIAFSGSTNSGEGSAIVKFTQSSQTFTTIAEGSYNGNGSTPDLRRVSNPSINNAGQVVFKAQDMNLVNHAVEASGSSLSYLVDHLAVGNIYNPLVRVQSPTLDVVRYVAPAVPFAGIHKGDGVNTTSIAVSPTTLYEYVDDGFSISNPGAVSFIANPVGPVEQAVYVSWGGSGQNSQDPNPMKIADTNGAFESFDQTAVSLAGVAFRAKLDVSEAPGVFLGDETFNTIWEVEKVLAAGDTISGHPLSVSNVNISPTAINDQGQIAMRVSFGPSSGSADSMKAQIIRADPFTLKSVYETGMAMAAIKTDQSSSISQMIEFLPGNETLAFDYAFPADTGNLVVSLGGQVLAELDANNGVADDLTRFETEVDLAALYPDGTSAALLEFQLYSNDATAGLYLDNIGFASLANGDFSTGDLSAWQSSFAAGDGVGVAVNPYITTAAVPEPTSAALLLAVGCFGLLRFGRGRAAKTT